MTEHLGKFFHRWLSAARTVRHRRLTLDRKETQIKVALVSAAWDKWRDRFKQQRLQPVVSHDLASMHLLSISAAGICYYLEIPSNYA